MNITNSDFEIIKKAIALLPHGDELDVEKREIVHQADLVLCRLNEKRNRDNNRTAKYIAEKRKVDKTYARSKAK